MTEQQQPLRAAILAIVTVLVMTAGGCLVKDDVNPGPVPPGQKRILILYESSAANTRGQLNSMYSPAVRAAAVAAAGEDGFRMFDKDMDLSNAPDWVTPMEQAKAVASTNNLSLPVIVFFGKGKPQAHTLETPEKTLALIKGAK